MARLAKRLSLGVVVLLALVLVGAGVLVLTIDAAGWGDRIERRATAALGRTVTVGGPVGLTPGLTPVLTLEGVTVAGPAGDTDAEGEAAPLARIDRLEVAVPLGALLRGTLRIDRLAVEGGTVDLGGPTGGWSAGGGGGPAPDLGTVRLEDVTVTWPRQAGAGHRLTVAEGTIAPAEDAADRLAVDLTGSLDGREASLRGQVGGLAALAAGGRLPLDLTAEVAGARLAVSGTVDRSAEPPTLDLEIGAEVSEPARLADLLGRTLPLAAPTSASATLTGTVERWEIAGLDATVGDSTLGGTLTVVRGGARPAISGTVTSGRLDPADFRPAPAEGAPAAGGGRLIPDLPLPVGWLGAVDTDLALDLQTVVLPGPAVEALTGRLEIAEGAGTLTVDAARIWQGDMAGTLSVDSAAAPPAFRIDGRVAQLALEAMLGGRAAGSDLSGTADLALTLRGAGDSLAGVIATLDGTAGLVSGQARLDGRWLDVVGRSVFTAVLPSGEEQVSTPLNCAVARFDVAGGIMDSQALLIDTPDVTIGGQGKVDLAAETLDIVLTPNPKRPQIAPLTVPVRIHGPIVGPSVVADPGSVIEGAATSLLLGAINPLALVVPLVNIGQTDDNPCIAALRGEATGTGGSGPVGTAVEGVGNVLEGVGGGLRSLFGAD